MLKASLKNPALQRYWIQCLYSTGVAVYCFDGHDAVGWNRYYSRLLGLLSLHRSLLLLWSWPLNLSRCYSRKTITTHLRKYNHNRITDAVQIPLFCDECGHDLLGALNTAEYIYSFIPEMWGSILLRLNGDLKNP